MPAMPETSPATPLGAATASARYQAVRRLTEALAAPLTAEDCLIQSMPDTSPVKWHLAHTSWFFETFVMAGRAPGYRPFRAGFDVLFNSYYQTVGPQHPRPHRGLLSRPTLDEVYDYRRHVDAAMATLLAGDLDEATRAVVELGLNHEQQHQELILMDVKHALGSNPLRPAYRQRARASATATGRRWIELPGGDVEIGHAGPGFAFDNETPRHRVRLEPFRLASHLVTCAEWLAFMAAGGYARPDPWLADGWSTVQREGWTAPLYWERLADQWHVYELGGRRPVDPAEPVCHVSYYEADAFARWAGARLPTEAEWEHASAGLDLSGGGFLDAGHYHPQAALDLPGLQQMFGDVWQWTASAYAAYPGYRPLEGSLGEYNGKFMCNQMVLRGACCATPRDHARRTYRNFYYPHQRWMFAGVRLAE
jgi:ergothioneine biosynthesis protein EgtB